MRDSPADLFTNNKVKLYLIHTPSPSGEDWGEVRRGLGRGKERVVVR